MIEILVHENKNFEVFLFDKGRGSTLNRAGLCKICNFWHINQNYVDIINQLKKSGLIPEGYPIMCCECWARLIGKLPYDKIISRKWFYECQES